MASDNIRGIRIDPIVPSQSVLISKAGYSIEAIVVLVIIDLAPK